MKAPFARPTVGVGVGWVDNCPQAQPRWLAGHRVLPLIRQIMRAC